MALAHASPETGSAASGRNVMNAVRTTSLREMARMLHNPVSLGAKEPGDASFRFLLLSVALSVGFSLTLASCGGGGGGGSNPPPPPSAPTGLSALSGNGQVTIAWNVVAGATSYNLYRATVSGVSKSNYATLPGGTKIVGVTAAYMNKIGKASCRER